MDFEELKAQHGEDAVKEAFMLGVIQGMKQAQEWQPIETAPVDVWCLFLDGNKTMREPIYGQNQHIDKILKDERGQTACAYIHNYTHWQPLPPPPQEQQK